MTTMGACRGWPPSDPENPASGSCSFCSLWLESLVVLAVLQSFKIGRAILADGIHGAHGGR
jgi:hypothetical protein